MGHTRRDISAVFNLVDEKLFDIALKTGVKETVRMIEAALIAKAINEGEGNLSEGARLLKTPQTTFYSRQNVLQDLVSQMARKARRKKN